MKEKLSVSEQPVGIRRQGWREVSDEEIITTDYITSEPEKLERVMLEVPEDSETARVEYAYDVSDKRRDLVRCSHCREVNHYRGFVMKTEDGTRFLVGNICGKKIYGIEFNAKVNEFEYNRNRKDYLLRRRRVKAALPSFAQYLGSLLLDPNVMSADAVFHAFQTDLKPMYEALAHAIAKNDGILTIQEQVRDYEAEVRRKEELTEKIKRMTTTQKKKMRKAGSSTPDEEAHVYRSIEKQIRVTAGRKIFENSSSICANIRQAVADLNLIHTQIDGDMTNAQFKSHFLRLSDLIGLLDGEFNRQHAAAEFFHADSLKQIAPWLEKAFRGRYRYQVASNGILKVDENNVTVSKAYIPPGYRPLAKTRLENFRQDINSGA